MTVRSSFHGRSHCRNNIGHPGRRNRPARSHKVRSGSSRTDTTVAPPGPSNLHLSNSRTRRSRRYRNNSPLLDQPRSTDRFPAPPAGKGKRRRRHGSPRCM
jgi:hypothetical protein